MTGDVLAFFQAVISAGAILSGFCGTFLAFRIQREANYYRQPAVNFERGEAKDIFVGLTHFTSSFLLIILATLCSLVFGFVIPLFALAGKTGLLIAPPIVVAGLVASVLLLIGYFFDEMVHYRIISWSLYSDAREWGRERPIIVVIILITLIVSVASYYLAT